MAMALDWKTLGDMMTVHQLAERGYRYIEGVLQYSAGVAAEPGYEIQRVRLATPVPLAEGFAAIAATLTGLGLPLSAFCACELRSPEPFTEAGFVAFNREYADQLQLWGLFDGDRNPLARTNVCPLYDPPPVPSLAAFSYAVSSSRERGGFIVAGSGEVPEGHANYRDHIVRLGDTSPEAMREKVDYVVGTMEARLQALGYGWPEAGSIQVYTVHESGLQRIGELAARFGGMADLSWHVSRPPVVDIEFEMDVRGAVVESLAG